MSQRFNFTRARLERLTCSPKPDGGHARIYAYDDDEPGLCLCVTSSGAKVFYLYRKIDGRPERIRLGSFPDISIDEARDGARVRKGKIALGINPADERRAARGAMMLGELFDHYLDSHAKHHKKTWEGDQKQFDRYFGKPAERQQPDDEPVPFPGWRVRRVDKITTDDVKTLHTRIGSQHGKYSANRMLALLSCLFNNAGLPNPTKGVKRFREQPRERFMDADELQRFWKALDDDEDKMFADFFRLCLYTLTRRANVQAMAWRDVNFGRREWTVAGETTKNGDPLVVSLTDQAMAVLQRRWTERTEGDAYVFPSHGASGHITEPKFAWKRIIARAKITNLRIHDLRHTGASWMAIGNASLSIIGKALGHKSHQSTARYAHVNRSAAATALQSATNAMAQLAPAAPVQGKGKRKVKSA